jgi:NEDD4-binding protein 2
MSENKELILMRGLPWSGKSFRAKELIEEASQKGIKGVIYSTDDYWYKIEDSLQPDVYSYNWEKIKQAHEWNQKRFKEAVDDQMDLIIIDNTNTCKKEVLVYFDYANFAGYKVSIEEPTSPHWLKMRHLLISKNEKDVLQWSAFLAKGSLDTHKVPQESIKRMMLRWEEFSIQDLIGVTT